MIKDSMNLPLGIDTQYIKSTGGVFTTATDAEILPYTIGYIPFSMLDKARIFKNVGKYTNTSVPNVSFRTIRQSTLYEPSKGVPFVYTIKTIQENQNFHGFYDTAGNTWNTSFIGYSNTSLRALHSYDTDHFVNASGNNGLNVAGVRLVFILFETLGNGGWGGTSPQTVADKTRVSVTATFSAVSPDIVLSFSASVSSSFGSHTYTIDNSIFNAMDENGVFQIDGGTYSSGGTDFERHLFGAIEQIYVETSGQNLPTNSPGFGVIIAENFRNSQTLYDQNHTNVRNTYGTQSTNYLVSANECMYLFDSQYGYFWEYVENNVSLFRFAVSSWINCPVFCGATWSDILICICTALPAYLINEQWYVAEFTDDYYITGKLIPYANARDWQKNINGDTNEFDYNDIPEDEPGGDDSENVGDSVVLPSVFGVGTTNGFVTQYALRKSDIQQLGALLWTSFVDADYWQNYLFSLALDTGTFSLAGLMSFFVSLKVYPFPLVNVSGLVSEGGNDMYVGTGIVPLHFTNKLHSLTSYVDKIEGGYADVMSNYFFKDWRDYVNTEIILYVPYCGTIHLNPADVVGNRVRIRYVIDFSTGGCVAYVMCDAAGEKSFMIGALPGQIGADVPLSATAAGEIAARFIGDAMNAGHLVGGEVGSVASGIAGAAFGKNDNDHPILGGGSGSPFAGIAGVYGGLPGAMGADLAPGVASQALTMLTRSAVSAPLMSGGRGFASFGAPQIPYIQIRRGIYPEISKLSEISGKPSAGTYKVGDLSGFVSGVVKTDGINAHENEKAKIRRLIAGGIYV